MENNTRSAGQGPTVLPEAETSRHLFQRALYRGPSGNWTDDFAESLNASAGDVHLDLAAIASFLSFGMVGQQRTLLKEISRRPWMSRLSDAGEPVLEMLPAHGFFTESADKIARELYRRLCDEARTACDGFPEIFILLSGGLDSRIVAGVLARLYEAGEIATKPVAVTWGLPDSRDVVYARKIAQILGFDWQHVEFGPEEVLENIEITACHLGLLHSPEMLHAMPWFRHIPQSSLVIAGSFGDSIGRAEFAGRRLLELTQKRPTNAYGLMKSGVFRGACVGLQRDLDEIHARGGPQAPPYARNEHWMQGFRMRGGLCHALTIINRYARVYQMFTAPEVYGFMWSLHPVRRNDDIYAVLLANELPEIAKVPWPRTNRALSGATEGAQKDLRAHYHEYTKWSSGPLYAELCRRIDAEWFEATGVFEPTAIESLAKLVGLSQERVGRLNDIWLWLAGFRSFVEGIEETGRKLVIEADSVDTPQEPRPRLGGLHRLGVLAASRSSALNGALKTLRSYQRKRQLRRLLSKALRDYPPRKGDWENA